MSSPFLRRGPHESMGGMDMSSPSSGSPISSSSNTNSSTASMSPGSMDSMAKDFTTTSAPLWLSAFLPTSTGAILAACIALLLLAAAHRLLHALERLLQRGWVLQGWKRERSRSRGTGEEKTGRGRGVPNDGEGQGEARRSSRTRNPGWYAGVDLPRGLFQMLLSAVGYLLMLAVMTFNVYYFISVLIGLGIGECVFGRYGRALPPSSAVAPRDSQQEASAGGPHHIELDPSSASPSSPSSSSSGGFRSFSGDGSPIHLDVTRLEGINVDPCAGRRAGEAGGGGDAGRGVAGAAHRQQASNAEQRRLLHPGATISSTSSSCSSGRSSSNSNSNFKVEGVTEAEGQARGIAVYELDRAEAK